MCLFVLQWRITLEFNHVMAWCLPTHENRFLHAGVESDSSLCIMFRSLCKSQPLLIFWIETFKIIYTYCIKLYHIWQQWFKERHYLCVEHYDKMTWKTFQCSVVFKKASLPTALAPCPRKMWYKQQVCNRSFSPGCGQASHQMSQGAEHRWSMHVVYQYWTAEMSPFHQR